MILGATSLTILNSCTATIPGIRGVDEETSTIYVDRDAMPPEVEAYLNKLGVNVEKIDALQEHMDKQLDSIHSALDSIGTAAIPGEGGPLDMSWQILLLYLFGRAGIKDGKGVMGALARKLVTREEKKVSRAKEGTPT